jgi:hypothetical protein
MKTLEATGQVASGSMRNYQPVSLGWVFCTVNTVVNLRAGIKRSTHDKQAPTTIAFGVAFADNLCNSFPTSVACTCRYGRCSGPLRHTRHRAHSDGHSYWCTKDSGRQQSDRPRRLAQDCVTDTRCLADKERPTNRYEHSEQGTRRPIQRNGSL